MLKHVLTALLACSVGVANVHAQISGAAGGWGNPSSAYPASPGSTFKYVAGGNKFSLGITASGGYIVAWGNPGTTINDPRCATCNSCGSCDECVPQDGDYVAVAAGWDHALALHSNGSIRAWTCSDYNSTLGYFGTVVADPFYANEVVQDPPIPHCYLAVGAGEWFSLVLRCDGSIWAWGDDSHDTISDAPVETGFQAIAAGGHHGVALDRIGLIHAWGGEEYGNNSCQSFLSAHPGTVPTDLAESTFLAIGAGHSATYGILDDGYRTIVGWGCLCAFPSGTHMGVTGSGTELDPYDYSQSYFVLGTNGKTVTGGYNHGCALLMDGSLLAWGSDSGPSNVCSGQQTGTPNVVPYAFSGTDIQMVGPNNVGKHNILIYDMPE